MKPSQCFVYFKYYDGEDPQVAYELLESKLETIGIQSTQFLFDQRNQPSVAFKIMNAKIEAGEASMIVVPSLDHLDDLVANFEMLATYLCDLSKNRVIFKSLDDLLSSDEPAFSFLPKLSTALNKARKSLKSARIREARMEAKRSGERIGRSKKRDEDKILQLRKEGLSIRQIAKQLGTSTWPVQETLKQCDKKSDISM